MVNVTPEDLRELLNKFCICNCENDVERLYANYKLIADMGLIDLNKKLIRENRRTNVFSTLTEHNFTANLIKSKNDLKNDQLLYEPCYEGQNKPVDLHIIYKGINFWIQIKRSSSLKSDNIRDKLFDKIENCIKLIQVNRYLNLEISEDFNQKDIEPLVRYIQEVALDSYEEKTYQYHVDELLKAEFSFLTHENLKLEHLTFGWIGSLYAEWITGLCKEQIITSFYNAVETFYNYTDSNHINLIVIEIDQPPHDAIDICEALYGRENFTFDQGKCISRRDSDGLFRQESFSKKVAGVLVLKRKNGMLVDDYWQVLCVNPESENLISSVEKLIQIDKVVMRYTWIKEGFFGLTL